MADTTDYIGIGLGLAGPAYAGYQVYATSKVRSDWDKVQADFDTLFSLIRQYAQGVNEIIAKFNTAFAGGTLDNADVDIEEAALAQIEKQIETIIKIIYKDLDQTEDDAEKGTGMWGMIEGAVEMIDPDLVIWKKLVLGGAAIFVGVKAGLWITKMVKGMKDDWNDTNHPGGVSGTCPKCGAVKTGNTTEHLQFELQRHLVTVHTLDVTVMAAIMPGAVDQFHQLPDWVQKELAVEAGITEFYMAPASEWTWQMRNVPWYFWALLAFTVIAILIIPELAPAVGSALRGMQGALAPAVG